MGEVDIVVQALNVDPITVEVHVDPLVPIIVEVKNEAENAKVSVVVQGENESQNVEDDPILVEVQNHNVEVPIVVEDHVPSQVAENNVGVENDNVNVDVKENENVNVMWMSL
ncbi:hypothetical protein JCGZ_27142 [Jatropha curcas]|uniref:Uncharacterized protein n=1 Tax=Jatropha curcas TaxID=180498 RepID=A0A067JM39_JATCU|nr:hypothetical protein JCGZ_27142 [Jatropha curcas]